MVVKNKTPRLYSVNEVAEIFAVNTDTVLRWCSLKRIRSLRTPGGHLRIPESAVTRLIDAGGGERGDTGTD